MRSVVHLLKKYENNIVLCDTRINSMHNVSAHVILYPQLDTVWH
jgi:hypothetical protein